MVFSVPFIIYIQEKVVRINENKDNKVVAISDVHGHYEVLQRLIDKLDLTPEDYLISSYIQEDDLS